MDDQSNAALALSKSNPDPTRAKTLASLLKADDDSAGNAGLQISLDDAPLPATTISDALALESQQLVNFYTIDSLHPTCIIINITSIFSESDLRHC